MRALALSLCCLMFAGCITRDATGPQPGFTPQGPPQVQADVVLRHAEQFNDDLAPRPAGSQQEFAAATYINAHLQQAGYRVRLDGVPFQDTVRSTNVMALPGSDPEYAVVVPYDTELQANFGRGLGLFLELARALEVARPDHRVAFVALGAETTIRGSEALSLGSRRFVQFLLDEGSDPTVIAFTKVGVGDGMTIFGSETDPGLCELANGAADTQGPICYRASSTPSLRPELYGRAGLTAVGVAGDVGVLARVLLKFLAGGDL